MCEFQHLSVIREVLEVQVVELMVLLDGREEEDGFYEDGNMRVVASRGILIFQMLLEGVGRIGSARLKALAVCGWVVCLGSRVCGLFSWFLRVEKSEDANKVDGVVESRAWIDAHAVALGPLGLVGHGLHHVKTSSIHEDVSSFSLGGESLQVEEPEAFRTNDH